MAQAYCEVRLNELMRNATVSMDTEYVRKVYKHKSNNCRSKPHNSTRNFTEVLKLESFYNRFILFDFSKFSVT